MNKFFRNLDTAPENYGLLRTIYFAFFTRGIMTVMIGSLLPYVRDANALTYSQSGMLLSAHQCGNLLAVLVAGFLPYAVGRKKSTLIMDSGTAIGFALAAISGNPWVLAAAFALSGIGRGTMSNICNVTVSSVSGNKSAAINLLHAIFAVGALLAPAILFVCTGLPGAGWRFAAYAVAALLLVAWVLILRSDLPDDAGKKESGGSLSFFRSVSFWINAAMLFFYLCAEASIIGWFVMYFEEIGILPAGMAQFTPSMLWAMMLAGRLACAAIPPRADKNKILLALSLSFALCFVGMLASRSAVPCVISLLGMGLSMAGIYPTIVATTPGSSSTAMAGALIAIASLGAILMPLIVGHVADEYGLAGGVATILAALASLTALALLKIFKGKTAG